MKKSFIQFYIIDKASKSIEPYILAHKPLGIIGIVGFPFYYYCWTYYMPQPYENFSMRLIGSLICFFLYFRQKWPLALQRYYAILFYISVIYLLPYFFTYFLLKSDATPLSLMSIVCTTYISGLIQSQLSFIITFCVGTSLAWIIYTLTSETVISASYFLQYWPVYIFAILTVSVSKFIVKGLIKDKIANAKLALDMCHYTAHEFRTPLLGIKASCNFILKKLKSLLSDNENTRQLNDAIERINTHTNLINTLISSLLINTDSTYALHKTYKVFDINHCLHKVMESYPFKHASDRKKILIKKITPFSIFGQEELIIHVLYNLLNNAFDAIKNKVDGKIELWTMDEKAAYTLHVKDNGKGILPTNLPFIFDSYFSTKKNGFGIGLSFCHHVMRRMNGDITCKSKPNQFTEFIVFFKKEASLSTIGGAF